jgi:hypothetical protein
MVDYIFRIGYVDPISLFYRGFPKTSVFWEIYLKFTGKSGSQAAFSKAFPKTNRVLGKALYLP